MKSRYQIRAVDGGAEVLIYDEIGLWGITAKQFVTDLQALGEIAVLTVRICSPGGDVFDGWAIFNALKRHPARVVAHVDGFAASMASVVLMAADEIVMPENAFLVIHNPSAVAIGDADDMRSMAEALDKVTAAIVAAYVARSGQDDAAVRAMMDKESTLSAAEAVELGFADRLDKPVKMAAKFDPARLPQAVLAALQEPASETEQEPAADQERDAAAAASDGAEAARRSNVLAYALEVTELCALAGRPERAAAFLRTEASPAAVRHALQQARADAEPEIDASRPVPRGFHVETKTMWDRVIDRINGQS